MFSTLADPSLALPASALRHELNARAQERARRLRQRYDLTPGRIPSVIFGEDEGRHGNFHPASYAAIRANPEWARRLLKAHTAYRRARPRADWPWRELDCACSSDALLMNIFCHPDTLANTRVRALMGFDRGASPRFGVKPRVPLASGRFDATEVDLQLGSLLVEAKLTESGFQTARPALVERFRDLESVFDLSLLPRTGATVVGELWDQEQGCFASIVRGTAGDYMSYQLVRGALAAYATGGFFCVIADARRPELLERWHAIIAAVRTAEMRWRLQLLTWQEIAATLDAELQQFLDSKYGIRS